MYKNNLKQRQMSGRGADRACYAADNDFYGVNERGRERTTGAALGGHDEHPLDDRQTECLRECHCVVGKKIVERDLQP